MRRLALTATALSLAIVSALAATNVSRADANASVCAQRYGKGEGLECNFATYAQCSAYVSGISGTCVDNPYLRASSNKVLPRTRVGR